MRKALSFLSILILCSCGAQNEQTVISQQTTPPDSGATPPAAAANNKTPQKDFADWEKHQDSLRNEILKRKTNKILKESLLQEMYIRNVAAISRDSVTLNIPFDLHTPDCGAPDCYSTGVRLRFKLGDTLIFPDTLPFREHETGCVERELKLSGVFQLAEQSSNHVIYHSAPQQRTLVLFRSDKKTGTTAFYFTGPAAARINGQNVYSIMESYNDADPNSLYPFTSWQLTTNEYEHFLQ